jgi:hypothetical protein
MMAMVWWAVGIPLFACTMMNSAVLADESIPLTEGEARATEKPMSLSRLFSYHQWHYGGFVDLGYSLDFNFPDNHRFRNRGTTPRVNEVVLNMGGVYIKKAASDRSRWGTNLLVHAGEDAKEFGFGVNQPRVQGSDFLRHFGRANLSYLAPVGNGMTLQAGLFNSLIGYESLYTKDNFNYTRAWIADYSPYLMFGGNAVYPFNDQWTGAVFVINEFFHLQNTNHLPSYGVQGIFTPSPSWSMKETIYYGPDQSDTSLKFWRFFSDTIVEWKSGDVTVAGQYQVGTEKTATDPDPDRSLFMGAALPMRWHIQGPWSVGFRPEIYWDRDGLLTGFQQFIWAFTTTAECRVPYRWTTSIFRLEYRYDNSTGPGGGFFKEEQNRLTPGQNILIFSIVWTLDSP